MQELAHGFRGHVYHLDSQAYSPRGAELVKVEQHVDRLFYAKQFCKLKIASLLFPSHFPQVDACSVDFDSQDTCIEHQGSMWIVPLHRLYTHEVTIPREHQLFCTHMTMENVTHGKKRSCECFACIDHEGFHEERKEGARRVIASLAEGGIKIDERDPTDWCWETHTQQTVFFEVEQVDPYQVRRFLKTHPVFRQAQMEHLLHALEFINSKR